MIEEANRRANIVGVRLNDAEHHAVIRAAARQRRSVSAWLRAAIRAALRRPPSDAS